MIKKYLTYFFMRRVVFFHFAIAIVALLFSPGHAADMASKSVSLSKNQLEMATANPEQWQRFLAWRDALRADAVKLGISEAVFDAEFKSIAPAIAKVEKLDRNQPELVIPASDYIGNRVTDRRIKTGIEIYNNNKDLIEKIGEKYGVQPRYILALWASESDFGQNTDRHPAVASLTSLAFEGRRSTLFRKELLLALQIIQMRQLPAASLKASWAGAMGQTQFLPSSYLNYAITTEGKAPPEAWPDIWRNRGDVMASIANYLAKSGWNSQLDWGAEVRLPPALLTPDGAASDGTRGGQKPIAEIASLMGLQQTKTGAEWAALGIVDENGAALVPNERQLSLIRARENDGPYYLVEDNFRVILKWNRSLLFAIVVGSLADRINQ